jgi:ferrous iron transport protein A
MQSQPLNDIPAGETVRLVSIDGGRQLTRRLLSLGITPGAELEILHCRGQGVVIGRNGNRVALGRGIAEKLQAEKID